MRGATHFSVPEAVPKRQVVSSSRAEAPRSPQRPLWLFLMLFFFQAIPRPGILPSCPMSALHRALSCQSSKSSVSHLRRTVAIPASPHPLLHRKMLKNSLFWNRRRQISDFLSTFQKIKLITTNITLFPLSRVVHRRGGGGGGQLRAACGHG